MNKFIPFIIINKKEGVNMDGKYNTNDDATVELKKALNKSTASKNPNMSEAERKMKFQSRKN
jgi:hypothetical protein